VLDLSFKEVSDKTSDNARIHSTAGQEYTPKNIKLKAENDGANDTQKNDDLEITGIKEVSMRKLHQSFLESEENGNTSVAETSVFSNNNEVLLDAFTNTQRMYSALKLESEKYKSDICALQQELQTYKDKTSRSKQKLLALNKEFLSLRSLNNLLKEKQNVAKTNLSSLKNEQQSVTTFNEKLNKDIQELMSAFQSIKQTNKELSFENIEKNAKIKILEQQQANSDTELISKFTELCITTDKNHNLQKEILNDKSSVLIESITSLEPKIVQSVSSTLESKFSERLDAQFENYKKVTDNQSLGVKIEMQNFSTALETIKTEFNNELNNCFQESSTLSTVNKEKVIEYLDGNLVLRNEKLNELLKEKISNIAIANDEKFQMLNTNLDKLETKLVEYEKIDAIMETQKQLQKEYYELESQCGNFKCSELEHLNQIAQYKLIEENLSGKLKELEDQILIKEKQCIQISSDSLEKIKNLENLKNSQNKILEILETENKNLKLDIATWSCDECLKNSTLKEEIFELEEKLKNVLQEKIEFQEKLFTLENTLTNINNNSETGVKLKLQERNQTNFSGKQCLTQNVLADELNKNEKMVLFNSQGHNTSINSDFEVVSSSINQEKIEIINTTLNQETRLEKSLLAESNLSKNLNLDLKSVSQIFPNTKQKSITSMNLSGKKIKIGNKNRDLLVKKNLHLNLSTDPLDLSNSSFSEDSAVDFNIQLKSLLNTANKYGRPCKPLLSSTTARANTSKSSKSRIKTSSKKSTPSTLSTTTTARRSKTTRSNKVLTQSI